MTLGMECERSCTAVAGGADITESRDDLSSHLQPLVMWSMAMWGTQFFRVGQVRGLQRDAIGLEIAELGYVPQLVMTNRLILSADSVQMVPA
jgi:hypothetical protein